MRLRCTQLALLLGLLSSVAIADYTIKLKDGSQVKATAAPVYKNGRANFYTADRKLYTSLRESEVDREATEKSNMVIEAADIPDPAGKRPAGTTLRERQLVSSKGEVSRQLRDLEQGKKHAEIEESHVEGVGGTDTGETETGDADEDSSSKKPENPVTVEAAPALDATPFRSRLEDAERRIADLRQEKQELTDRLTEAKRQQAEAQTREESVNAKDFQSEIEQNQLSSQEIDNKIRDVEKERATIREEATKAGVAGQL